MAIKYSEQYDVQYDTDKDVWLESNCGDTACEFCRDRPERHSEIALNEEAEAALEDAIEGYIHDCKRLGNEPDQSVIDNILKGKWI